MLRGSYSHHYRRLLPDLLAALEFRGNNTTHRPVMDAVELLQRYKDIPVSDRPCYSRSDRVPLDGVVPRDWRDAVVDDTGKVERIPYELCVLKALREAIRRREVWIVGANRWRNPDDDLPADFEENRDVHYAAIRAPLNGAEFTADLKTRLAGALTSFDTALTKGTTGGVHITTRRGEGWIHIPSMDKLPAPPSLDALKVEVQRRWGTIDLLDILKEADFLTGFTSEFTSVMSREALPEGVLRRRLLLVLFALGTNVGIKRIADGLAVASGELGDIEATLRRVRASHVTRDNLRKAVRRLVTAGRLPDQPSVTIYSTERISIAGPGVVAAEITQPSSKYHYQYSGLRLLLHSPDRYLLLPVGWQHGQDPVFVLHDNDTTRVDITAQ